MVCAVSGILLFLLLLFGNDLHICNKLLFVSKRREVYTPLLFDLCFRGIVFRCNEANRFCLVRNYLYSEGTVDRLSFFRYLSVRFVRATLPVIFGTQYAFLENLWQIRHGQLP